MPTREFCAFLLEGEHGRQEIFQVLNVDGLWGSFQVPDSEVDRARAYAQRRGLDIRAFIHSHHSTVRMSPADLRSHANSPYPWIVVHAGPRGLDYKTYPVRGQA